MIHLLRDDPRMQIARVALTTDDHLIQAEFEIAF
jgi:hypothetical protein